jgi:prophage regulatory protein
MTQRVYRMAQLASIPDSRGLLPISPATIWRWCNQGVFPKPFKLGDRVTVWDAGQVESWMAARSPSKVLDQ